MELLLLATFLLTTIISAQPLRVTSRPDLARVPAGDQLTLNCSLEVKGIPFWRGAAGADVTNQRINSTNQLIAIHTIATVSRSRNGSVLQCVANLTNGTQLVSDVIIQVLFIEASIPIQTIATEVRIGESVILSCSPNAWPLAPVTWWQNGSQVSVGDQLIVPVLSYEVAGEYQCRAKNSEGNASSSAVEVTVSAARARVILYRNASTTLNLSCQGTEISWQKSGLLLSPSSLPSGLSLIPFPTHSVLLIDSLNLMLTGRYVCMQGSVTNSEYSLKIPSIEDTFTTAPVSREVLITETVTLLCVPTGVPPPETTWYREGTAVPLSNTSSLSLPSSGALTFSNFSPSQAGKYSCVAHNPAGFRKVSADLFLIPLPAAVIRQGPDPIYLGVNESVELDCMLAPDRPAIYSWTRDDQPLPSSGQQLLASSPGVYRCEVEIATSEDSVYVHSSALQLLQSSLQFNGSIGDQEVREGDTLSVMCRISGGSANFSWFLWTQQIRTSGDALTLDSVRREQAGRYTCRAADALGAVIVQSFSLSVRFGPFVAAFQAAVSLQEGDNGMLRCEVSGYPAPIVQWFQTVDNANEKLINASLPNNSLLLRNVKLSDAGTYKCVATDPLNQSNSANATIQLSVLRSLPPISSLSDASLPAVLIPLSVALALALLCVCGIVTAALAIRRCSCSRGRNKYSRDLRESEEGTVRSKFSPKAHYQPLGSTKIPSAAGARNREPEVSFPMIGFPRDELHFGTRLGDGAYGPIIEGSIEEFLGERRHVAVECYISNSEEGSFPKPDELHTWPVFYLQHDNLSQVLGICTSVEPYYVIYEYSDRGCLKEFLQAAKEQLPTTPPDTSSRSPNKRGSAVDVHFVLTQAHLLRMCRQAALGLEFLAQRDMVFRDVATRNCCVSSSLDIKLINLPIGPNLFPGDYFRRDKEFLPVRWMSPESLQNSQFTTKSDVWAYGVFCWEVFTYARPPYETQSDEQVLEKVPEGLRLSAPEEGCPDGAYRLMNQCWNQNPDRRPSFSTLCVHLHDVTCDD